MPVERPSVRVRTVVALIAAAAINVALLWTFHNRYWYPVDEGIYATMAERILEGEIPHLDFQDFHPGYGEFLNAAAFRLFGVDLVSLRYLLIAGAFLQSVFVFGLIQRRSLLLAFCAAVASVALGVVHFLNPTAHWYALYGTGAVVYWMMRAPRDHWVRLAGAGVLVGAVTLFHQLIGVLVGTAVLVIALRERSGDAAGTDRLLARFLLLAPLAGLITYLVRAPTVEVTGALLFASWPLVILLQGLQHVRTANRDALRVVLSLGAGALVSAIPLVLYCAINGSWQQTFEESVLAALSLGVRDDQAQPWYAVLSLAGLHLAVTPSTPGDVANGLFWMVLPLAATVNGLFIMRSRTDRHTAHPLPTVSAFYAVSSLYMQNAIYLFFTVGLSLAAVLWWLASHGRPARAAAAMATATLATIAVAFHAAQPSTRSNNEMLRGTNVLSGEWSEPLKRATLRLDRVEQFPYGAIVDVIQSNAPEGASILAVPNNAELYFLSGRRNPFPFYNTWIGIRNDRDLTAVLERLQAAPPAVVTFRPNDQYNSWASRAIMDHVRSRYDRIGDIGGVELYRVRGTNRLGLRNTITSAGR